MAYRYPTFGTNRISDVFQDAINLIWWCFKEKARENVGWLRLRFRFGGKKNGYKLP